MHMGTGIRGGAGVGCWDGCGNQGEYCNGQMSTGAWCTLSPVLRTGTCARSCVLRVWCLLSGQICYTEFCPGTSLNNTAVGSPIYLQCCSCAFKTSKLPPLPRGTDSRHAGLHTARPRASAGRRRPASGRGGVGPPPTPHRLRPAGVPWERRRGWRCANSAVKRRALRGSVA